MKPLSRREQIYEQAIQKIREWADRPDLSKDEKLMFIKYEFKLLDERMARLSEEETDNPSVSCADKGSQGVQWKKEEPVG